MKREQHGRFESGVAGVTNRHMSCRIVEAGYVSSEERHRLTFCLHPYLLRLKGITVEDSLIQNRCPDMPFCHVRDTLHK